MAALALKHPGEQSSVTCSSKSPIANTEEKMDIGENDWSPPWRKDEGS